VHDLVGAAGDVAGSLDALVEAASAADAKPAVQEASRPERPEGELTADQVCQAIGAILPEGSIVSDESNTSGLMLAALTAGGPPHDVLTLTGGAIGQGLPVAVGAAVACPDRPVLALEAEGSAMYTIQSLWTMAREQLDVTVVIFNNRSYAILNVELQRVGARGDGEKAQSQLDLTKPDLDLVSLGQGLGVPSVRATSGEQLTAALERAIAEPGPHLIEAPVPPTLSPAQLRVMPYALKGLGMLPRPIASAIKRRLYP
jgi:acetolactate synthase I/II/III large subunit